MTREWNHRHKHRIMGDTRRGFTKTGSLSHRRTASLAWEGSKESTGVDLMKLSRRVPGFICLWASVSVEFITQNAAKTMKWTSLWQTHREWKNTNETERRKEGVPWRREKCEEIERGREEKAKQSEGKKDQGMQKWEQSFKAANFWSALSTH